MQDIFALTKEEYRLERKASTLRQKIAERTRQLNIVPDHDTTGHYYKYKDNKFPSVTGRLQLLKDPALANWKMNRALDYIFQNFPVINDVNLADHLERAKQTPQTEFENAGSIGTQVHNWREEYFTELMRGNTDHPITHTHPQVISGCRAVKKFVEETKYIPIACELYLADEKLETGGSADDIGILNGKLTFLDLKTSNVGDKDSYFYQVALYVYMFEKLYGIRTQQHMILHASKTDGTYGLIPIPEIRTRIKEAKHIVNVDKFLNKLKEQKKKQPIII